MATRWLRRNFWIRSARVNGEAGGCFTPTASPPSPPSPRTATATSLAPGTTSFVPADFVVFVEFVDDAEFGEVEEDCCPWPLLRAADAAAVAEVVAVVQVVAPRILQINFILLILIFDSCISTTFYYKYENKIE